MKFITKKVLILPLIIMLTINTACSFNLDETVNDEIRKNYNDTKLIDDTGINTNNGGGLPDLPNIVKNSKPKSKPDVSGSKASVPKSLPAIPYKGGNIKIKSGTKFNVVNTSAISDWQKQGTSVKFKTVAQTSGNGYTIPAGTILNGEIVESHQPQISCNGGLVAIRVYSMFYNGHTVPLNAYVVRAKDKKVFFDNIKGERTYLKTMWKKGNWGRSLFNRMLSLTVNLGGSGSTLVLSPFPFVYGTLCLGANTLISPITAFFSKGGHVSIPAGSRFILKLNEAVYVN